MILNPRDYEDGSTVDADVAVVGAGPAGIVTALELANGGFDVALVESGRTTPSRDVQRLTDAEDLDPEVHTPLAQATRRQLGGGSVIWGGRCVPYDRVDFDPRPELHDVRWPS